MDLAEIEGTMMMSLMIYVHICYMEGEGMPVEADWLAANFLSSLAYSLGDVVQHSVMAR